METIEIPFKQEYKYLEKALAESKEKYTKIPSNVIIDKTLTGIGATHMEIEAKRPSIIIEPNVPVIFGKATQHKGTLAVYKGCSKLKIKNYFLDNSIEHKKFITTPEGFSKIKNVALELNIDIHKDYFCLFDECEKIMQDVNFRENITQPIDDFFDFEQKAFISATPLDIKHGKLVEQGFKRLKIKPDFDYQEKLELNIVSRVNIKIISKLNSLNDSECICVFYNSLIGIRNIITYLKLDKMDYNVYCSSKSLAKMETLDFVANENFDAKTMKKYSFFSCRFFSAVDMILDKCPDIVIITNLNAIHSIIDPLSDAIQIQGRFRKIHSNDKRYNSLCHITNLAYLNAQTKDEVKEELEEWAKTFYFLKDKYQNVQTDNQKSAILKEFRNTCLYPFLVQKNLTIIPEINYFRMVNKYNEERVKGYYRNENLLYDAYKLSNYFKVTPIYDIDPLFTFNDLDDLIFKISNPTASEKDKIKAIVNNFKIEGVTGEMILTPMRDIESSELYTFTKKIVEACDVLGCEYIENKSFKTIEKELDIAIKFNLPENDRFSEKMVSLVIAEFESQFKQFIPTNEVRDRLKKIYMEQNIIIKGGKPFKVTQKTIKEYFDAKLRGDTRTCRIKSILPNILEISKKNDN